MITHVEAVYHRYLVNSLTEEIYKLNAQVEHLKAEAALIGGQRDYWRGRAEEYLAGVRPSDLVASSVSRAWAAEAKYEGLLAQLEAGQREKSRCAA